jgi:hypothetical protein
MALNLVVQAFLVSAAFLVGSTWAKKETALHLPTVWYLMQSGRLAPFTR